MVEYYQRRVGELIVRLNGTSTSNKRNDSRGIREVVRKSEGDLKQTLMIVARNNSQEYNALMKCGIEDFLLRFKLFVQEIEPKQ